VYYTTKQISDLIKNKAFEIGFNGVGIAKAEKIEGFQEILSDWLQAGYHANMQYMERNVDKRVDPTVLVSGAKSVISLITSYYPEKEQPSELPKIAKYAYGTDYHIVLKDKMQQLWDFIEDFYPELEGRIFVDSAPVSDKLWAVKSGLGWIGKNSCLINKEIGSFVFISELIVNIELSYDEAYGLNFCGSCTKCIDNCPTKAIIEPGVIDSNKCISYQTIENKELKIPEEFLGKFENSLFGCDICQDVCPWNKKPLTTVVNEFYPKTDLFELDTERWQNISVEEFNTIFKKSALKRAKHSGLRRNIGFLSRKE